MNYNFRQIIWLLVFAAIFGIVRNKLFSGGVELIGNWRDLSSGDGPIVPPSAEEGDPPFIAIDVAQMEHSLGKTIFIDARDPEEFVCATIPGSLNMPFEYLPEGDLKPYLDSVLGGAEKDLPLIVFCSGEECDLSLHLARNLQDEGYTGVMIFFGGATEWEKFELEIERSAECEE